MGVLFSQLGIGLPALLAQGFNFLVVLVVLTVFVYKPLAKIVDARRKRIEEGLEHAREADLKLAQIAEKEKQVLTEADKIALAMIKDAELKAGENARDIIAQGEKRASGIVKESRTLAERAIAEGMVTLEKDAVSFVKEVFLKTVELEPNNVDEKLIEQAVNILRKARA